MGLATSAAKDGGDTAGAEPKARLAFMPARWRLSGRGCATSRARNLCRRAGEWMGADLSALDIVVVQIDGIYISEHLVLVAALGIDSQGFKHPLGLMEGATEQSISH